MSTNRSAKRNQQAFVTTGILLVVAVHGSLFWISHRSEPRALVGDEKYHWAQAQDLAAGEPATAQPLRLPFYPRFLAQLIGWFGTGRLAVEIAQTLLLAAAAWFLYRLALVWTQSRMAAGVAGFLMLGYPSMAAYAHYLWPETLHLFLFLGALWCLSCRAASPWWSFAAGAVLGLAAVTKAVLLPFVPVLLFLLPAPAHRERWRRAAWATTGLAAVLLGFLALGAIEGRTYVSATTFNAWVGLNDEAAVNHHRSIVDREYKSYSSSAGSAAERDRLTRRRIGRLVAEKGVARLALEQLRRQYIRLFHRDTFLIDQLPGGVLHGARRGYRAPPPAIDRFLRTTNSVLYGLVLATVGLGLVAGSRPVRHALRPALAFVVYNLAIFLLLHVKTRYRVQFMPFMFVFSGCAAAWLHTRIGKPAGGGNEWGRRLGWKQISAAVVGALVLLYLAFGT